MSKWIALSKREPTELELYQCHNMPLVCDDSGWVGQMEARWHPEFGVTFQVVYEWRGGGRITHWRMLPEPYTSLSRRIRRFIWRTTGVEL